VAALAGLLAIAPPPGEPRRPGPGEYRPGEPRPGESPPGVAAPRFRPLLSGRMALLSAAALTSYLGAASLPFLVALHAEDNLRLRPDLTGLVLLGFGLAGLLLGAGGAGCWNASARWCGATAALVTAAFVASVGWTGSVLALTLCWTAAGVGSSMVNVALQSLTVHAVRTTGRRPVGRVGVPVQRLRTRPRRLAALLPRAPPRRSPLPRRHCW